MAIIRNYEYELRGDSKDETLNLYERWLCQSQPYFFGGNMCNDVLRFRTQVPLTPFQGDLEKAIHRAVIILYEGHSHESVEYTAIDIHGKLPKINGKLPEQPEVPATLCDKHLLANIPKESRGLGAELI